MSRMTAILRGLINRTEEGKLNWQTSVNDDVFFASVDTTGVTIRSLGAEMFVGPERHRLEVLNDNGVTAVVLETPDSYGLVPPENIATAEQAQDMNRLFVLARKSALNIDSTLEKLVTDLDRIG